ncbi:MAG: hypothetical protein HOW73_23900 [Polyangiaceae bacterium]|nr:hypothetical protein [Polyangiaceae bacterium]
MRWSSMVKVGLSGTSLALAIGCSQPSSEEAVAETIAADDQAAEADEAKAKQDKEEEQAREDRRRERERRERLAADAERERASTDPSQPTPWFLRPAGNVTPASTQQSGTNGEQGRPLSNEQPKQQVVAPPQPAKPVVAQPQPINNKRGWGINRAACGRG